MVVRYCRVHDAVQSRTFFPSGKPLFILQPRFSSLALPSSHLCSLAGPGKSMAPFVILNLLRKLHTKVLFWYLFVVVLDKRNNPREASISSGRSSEEAKIAVVYMPLLLVLLWLVVVVVGCWWLLVVVSCCGCWWLW